MRTGCDITQRNSSSGTDLHHALMASMIAGSVRRSCLLMSASSLYSSASPCADLQRSISPQFINVAHVGHMDHYLSPVNSTVTTAQCNHLLHVVDLLKIPLVGDLELHYAFAGLCVCQGLMCGGRSSDARVTADMHAFCTCSDSSLKSSLSSFASIMALHAVVRAVTPIAGVAGGVAYRLMPNTAALSFFHRFLARFTIDCAKVRRLADTLVVILPTQEKNESGAAL